MFHVSIVCGLMVLFINICYYRQASALFWISVHCEKPKIWGFYGWGKTQKIQLLLHKSLTQCSLSLAQLFVYCMLYIRALSTITKATKMFSVHKSLFFQGKVLIRKISTLHDLTSKKKLTFSSTIFYVLPLKKQFSNIYPYLLEQNYKNL